MFVVLVAKKAAHRDSPNDVGLGVIFIDAPTREEATQWAHEYYHHHSYLEIHDIHSIDEVALLQKRRHPNPAWEEIRMASHKLL